MEYNVLKGKYFIFMTSTRFHVTGSSLLSYGRVFFSRGHELLSLSPRRYLLSCDLDFQSQLGV